MTIFARWFGLVFLISIAHAQDTVAVSAHDAIESIITDMTDEQNLQQYAEELEYYHQHPINIAQPNYNDLVKLPFISPMMAEAIILFTDTVRISSPHQLLVIPLLTDEVYKKLLPFILLSSAPDNTVNNLFAAQKIESRSRIERRLRKASGYTDNTFRGDVNNLYQRVRVGNAHLELAGLFEKDAGELYDDGLIAGYLLIKQTSIVNRAVLGNFNISSEQGLVFAKNIAVSKGSNVIGQIQKRGSTLMPSISTDEFRYFQGVAADIKMENFSLLSFYSNRKLPASVDSSNTVTSFYTSGIYRTENDLQRRKNVTENVLGAQMRYFIDYKKTVSFTLMNAAYDKLIKPSLFNLHGSKNLQAGSLSWELPFSAVTLFGELSSNNGMEFSKVLGIVMPLSRQISISYHHRNFSTNYISPFARPFGERDIISDGEKGNYIGAQMRSKNILLSVYADNYYLSPGSQVFGANGRELFLYSLYSPQKSIDLILQIRNKLKTQTFVRGSDDVRRQTNYRISYKLTVAPQLEFTQRFEIVNVLYNPSNYAEKGFLTFIEGTFKQPKLGVQIKSRLVFFDTDSYDSRLYQYESDVAGNFSNPPMYGNGIRWYFILGYEIMKNFRLSLKYSETKRLFEHVIGSSDDTIIGNLDNSITLQLDFVM